MGALVNTMLMETVSKNDVVMGLLEDAARYGFLLRTDFRSAYPHRSPGSFDSWVSRLVAQTPEQEDRRPFRAYPLHYRMRLFRISRLGRRVLGGNVAPSLLGAPGEQALAHSYAIAWFCRHSPTAKRVLLLPEELDRLLPRVRPAQHQKGGLSEKRFYLRRDSGGGHHFGYCSIATTTTTKRVVQAARKRLVLAAKRSETVATLLRERRFELAYLVPTPERATVLGAALEHELGRFASFSVEAPPLLSRLVPLSRRR